MNFITTALIVVLMFFQFAESIPIPVFNSTTSTSLDTLIKGAKNKISKFLKPESPEEVAHIYKDEKRNRERVSDCRDLDEEMPKNYIYIPFSEQIGGD